MGTAQMTAAVSALSLFILCGCVLSGCGSGDEARQASVDDPGAIDGLSSAAPTFPSHLEAIAQRDKLVVSCFPQQISRLFSVNLARGPMKRIGTADDFAGFDVEIMRLLAEDLDVALEIRPVTEPSYGQLTALLTTARADVIASGLTITESYAQRADFSAPYLEYVLVAVARRDDGPASVDALQQGRVAVAEGSSTEQVLVESGFPDGQIVRIDFAAEAYSQVAEGTVDFVLVDSIELEAVLADFPDLEARFRFDEAYRYGYAVPAGSDLDTRIDALIATLRADGRYDTLLQEAFGDSADLSRLVHLPTFGRADLAPESG